MRTVRANDPRFLRMRKGLFALVALAIPLAFAGGWLWGIDDGYNTGYRCAYLEMNNLLIEGLNNGRSFYISGLPVRFHPQHARTAGYTFWGLGDDTPVRTGRRN